MNVIFYILAFNRIHATPSVTFSDCIRNSIFGSKACVGNCAMWHYHAVIISSDTGWKRNLTQVSHVQRACVSSLISEAQIDMSNECVCGLQTVGRLSPLAVDAGLRRTPIRLRDCSALWITLFPSLPVRASSSVRCYYRVIRLPSFPVSATAVNATWWGVGAGGGCACVHTWLDGWVTVREPAQYVLSSQRNAINEVAFHRQLV